MKKFSALASAALLSTAIVGSTVAAKPAATSSVPYVTIGGINQGGPMN